VNKYTYFFASLGLQCILNFFAEICWHIKMFLCARQIHLACHFGHVLYVMQLWCVHLVVIIHVCNTNLFSEFISYFLSVPIPTVCSVWFIYFVDFIHHAVLKIVLKIKTTFQAWYEAPSSDQKMVLTFSVGLFRWSQLQRASPNNRPTRRGFAIAPSRVKIEADQLCVWT